MPTQTLHAWCRFTLVYVLYSTAIATPGHGSLSPLALGLTYYVIVATGVPLHESPCCLMPVTVPIRHHRCGSGLLNCPGEYAGACCWRQCPCWLRHINLTPVFLLRSWSLDRRQC